MYIVETSRGALAGLPGGRWFAAAHSSTLAQARADLTEVFAAKHDGEDRGEEYEREWDALIARAKESEVGDILAFDEFAARITTEDVDGER